MTQKDSTKSGASIAVSIATLEEHHDFPGPYMFKVIAFQTDDLESRVSEALAKGLGDAHASTNLRSRGSKHNRYMSVTVEPVVQDAAQVLAVYDELKKLEGLIALI